MKKGDYFHDRLKRLITEYILLGYKVSKVFPSDERFGLTSQCRRALLSVMFNYVEGYARSRPKQLLNFYETSYGSLQESITAFYFATQFKYISKENYIKLYDYKEEIAKMLWKTIEGLRKDIKE
jgi:four helix bundle protein